MNRLTLTVVGLVLLAACRPSSTTSRSKEVGQVSETVQSSDTTLVGKRLHLSFPTNESVVEYLSESHLFWRSQDSVYGRKEGEDRYNVLHIQPHIFFVNWTEADGTTVSQVLDLKARTCQAFLTSPVYQRNEDNRQTVVLSGKIDSITEGNHLLFEKR